MSQSLEAVQGPSPDSSRSRRRLAEVLTRWPVWSATLAGSLAVLVQAAGYALGWAGGETTAIVCWYVGFALLVAPFAALLLGATRTDHQRLGGVLSFSLLLYASWLLSNPVLATRFDESLHVTTLVSLVESGDFFAENTMLPVSPRYPGLELAAAAVHWMTGLPLFACQVLVVLLSRTVFVLAFFLLASRIGGSTRAGAAVVVLYASSPQFYFFNAQFSYQTLAIAMLLAALYLMVRAFDSPRDTPWAELLAAQACLAALALTHHLTSWLAVGALWVLALLFRLGHERRRFRLTLITAELATVVVAAWTAVILPLLTLYLGPIFESAGSELLRVVTLDGSARQLGSNPAGEATPLWQLLTMATAILIWCLLLIPAGWAALRGRTIGSTRARYFPLALALGYPLLQLGRFSSRAGEVADRASTFVTMALALVVGCWLVPVMRRAGGLVVPVGVVLVLGGTILGSGPDWQRVPGPYLAGAEQRSVDDDTIAYAQWAGRHLPEGSLIATDSTLSRVTPNFAPAQPVTSPGGYANVTPIFIYRGINEEVLRLIRDNEIDFVVVDTRLIGATVRSGSFFEGSNDYGPDAITLDARQLTKFDGYPGFDRVLDGPIRVYDVRALHTGSVPGVFADRAAPVLPGSWNPWQLGVGLLVIGVGLYFRGGLLNPMRFQARDLWRPAVVLPGLMVVGAVGVLGDYHPVRGLAALAAIVLLTVLATPRPVRRPALQLSAEGRTWALLIAVTLGAAVALAGLGAWEGLFGADPLPPPVTGTAAP